MALTTINVEFDITRDDRPDLPPPPAVAITPANPWPRPYYLENGLRRVAPYHYTYNTFCKARWRDREILDIFAAEFRDRTKEYYEKAIQEGRIVLNGKECRDVHTIVKNGDVISHTIHRHEPPVSAQPIRVVHETDEMIVIDKPAGIPVHPSGRYNYNSIIEIMRAERSYGFNPLPCNRLDRLTSGVMFVGKTGKGAAKLSAKLVERTVRKEYMARVKGRFPDGNGCEGDAMRGGIVKCEEPILQISPILGLNRARATGRTAKTLFRRVAYYPSTSRKPSGQETSEQENSSASPILDPEDDGYSIVHCLPLTGRTHQIRVHLQFLGHPISNDPIYSNRQVFGPSLAKGESSGERDEEITERLRKMGKTELADAYSYSKEVPITSSAKNTASAEIDIDLSTLNIDQTMQTTPSQLRLLQKSGSSADRPRHLSTIHAGPPPPIHTPSAPDPDSNPTSSHEIDPNHTAYVAAHDKMVADYNKSKGEKLTGEICDVCQTPLYSDPGPQELGIYLHALAYADVDGAWRYTSPMPEWTRGSKDTGNALMEPPMWDFEALGDDAHFDVEAEKDEAAKKNREGLIRNKRLAGDE